MGKFIAIILVCFLIATLLTADTEALPSYYNVGASILNLANRDSIVRDPTQRRVFKYNGNGFIMV